MTQITASLVNELRQKTGAGMMDCKKALTENAGDLEKAVDYLRAKGLSAAAKKSGRLASEGLVHSYIHGGGRVGVLLEVNCETDFVALNEDFKTFVADVCLHIAANKPLYVTTEEIPADVMEREREVARAQAREAGKPDAMIEKIADGKIKKFSEENCLLTQSFVKNPDISIATLTTNLVAKLGENVKIRRFARFELGEGLEKRSNDFAAEVAAQVGA